jgi:hypothetical protein
MALDPELIALLKAFAPQQQQQGFNPADFAALFKKEPPRHLGVGGGEVTADNPLGYTGGSPFSNGFFKNAAERRAVETDRLGMPGFSSLSPGQQMGALSVTPGGTGAERAIGASPAPWMPTAGMFQAPKPLTGYDTPENDAAALAKNFAMMKPGGMNGFWSRVGARR